MIIPCFLKKSQKLILQLQICGLYFNSITAMSYYSAFVDPPTLEIPKLRKLIYNRNPNVYLLLDLSTYPA